MPHQDPSHDRWLGPKLAHFGLGLLHALCSVAFFAAAFEQPPGNAWVYWPGVALVASAWGLWRRTWWGRPSAIVGCVVILASPVLLWGAIEVGPYGGGLALLMLVGYLPVAAASGIGLWWITRFPRALLFRERRPGFRWSTPVKVLVIVVLLAVGAGLHAARPIEAFFAETGDRVDREAADRLVGDLIAAVRTGDKGQIDSAGMAIEESKSGGRAGQIISQTFSMPPYPNPKVAVTIADALRKHHGPENAELRRALLRALHRCKSGRGDFFVQQTILELVDDTDAGVRALAVEQARGVIFKELAVEPLLKRLQDSSEEPPTRAKAASILEPIARDHAHQRRRPEIVAGLHEVSRTEVAQVRDAAIMALASIEPRELVQAVREGTLSVDEAIPSLVGLLRGADWDRRLRAAKALAEFGPSARAAVPELQAALTKSTLEWERAPLQEAIQMIEGLPKKAPRDRESDRGRQTSD